MSGGAPDPRWPELTTQLRRYIGRRVADPHLADDLTQEVLLRLSRQLHQGPMPDSPHAWLFRTAHNAVVDHHRTHRADATLPEDVVGEEADAGIGTDADDRPLLASFRAFLDALPAEQRQALEAIEFEGMTQQALAQQLGIPVSTVKSRVQRGRKKLEQQLRDCCAFEFDRRGGLVDWRRWPDSDCRECR